MIFTCPPRARLARLLADDLEPTEEATLARHVEDCPDCQRALEQLVADPITSGTRSPVTPRPPEEFIHRLKRAALGSGTRHACDGRSAEMDGPGVPPTVAGYRVLRILGCGGMGAVYEAEQDNPRRPVALKMIRPGIASPDLVKRFAREAHVLGRLHHAGIAQVYAAGLADDGQPYFAMELVEGAPLLEYAGRQRLDTAA